MSYSPPPRLVKGLLGVSLGLWLLLGSCAVWSGTAGSRLNGDIVEVVEEGARGERQGDDPKHAPVVRRELGPTLDVPDRYRIEVVGGWRQFGVGYPKLYVWMDRYAEDDDRLLNAGLLWIGDLSQGYRILNYWPVEELASVPLEELPRDVEDFVRRKLSVQTAGV